MDKLVTLQEVQALTVLFSKCTMSPAERLWAQMFANRLFAYAQPPKPAKPEKNEAEPESKTEPTGDILLCSEGAA